jgi:hypothetical protein
VEVAGGLRGTLAPGHRSAPRQHQRSSCASVGLQGPRADATHARNRRGGASRSSSGRATTQAPGGTMTEAFAEQTEADRETIRRAFEAWRAGTAAITDVFARGAGLAHRGSLATPGSCRCGAARSSTAPPFTTASRSTTCGTECLLSSRPLPAAGLAVDDCCFHANGVARYRSRDTSSEAGSAAVGQFESSARRRCASWTAMLPLPTAEATRLTEPWRTSPAAKTPGRLVSSSIGGRSSGQP